MITLVIFVLILGLLVFVHEFGHFIVARKMGVKAEEFGLGFPPRAVGIQKKYKGWLWWKRGVWRIIWGKKPAEELSEGEGGTIYSLNWVPLGGFVKIKGEAGESMGDADSFAGKPIWQRGAIISAGVLMNVVAAVVILSIGFYIGLPRVLDDADLDKYAKISDKRLELVEILKDSPAFAAGLKLGDKIIKVDGKEMISSLELRNYLKEKLNIPVVFEINRNGEMLLKEITPAALQAIGQPGVGIGYVEIGKVSYAPHLALWHGFLETGFYIKEIARAFYGIIHNLIIGEKVAIDVTGPVGIAVLTGRVARLGFVYLLQFTALLSVNLALVNIFPFPALDGGRLFFLVLEWIRRRPVPQRVENLVHNLGFALLMFLIAAVTYHDFLRFGGNFIDKIKTLVQ